VAGQINTHAQDQCLAPQKLQSEIAYVFHGWILFFFLQQEQRYPALLLQGEEPASVARYGIISPRRLKTANRSGICPASAGRRHDYFRGELAEPHML
jgi:hypothetical protein